MSGRLIENPDPEKLRIWGTLAYVSDGERKRILALPFGQFKPEIKKLEKQVKDMQKAIKQRLRK